MTWKQHVDCKIDCERQRERESKKESEQWTWKWCKWDMNRLCCTLHTFVFAVSRWMCVSSKICFIVLKSFVHMTLIAVYSNALNSRSLFRTRVFSAIAFQFSSVHIFRSDARDLFCVWCFFLYHSAQISTANKNRFDIDHDLACVVITN